MVNSILFRKKYDGILLRCLKKFDVAKVLTELHNGPIGGHFVGDTTAEKILKVGYY